MKTPIGKLFLNLLDKCFPKGSLLYKVLNRNTVKLSFSTTPNMACKLARHNKQVLGIGALPKPNPCTCRIKENTCMTTNVVYQVKVV